MKYLFSAKIWMSVLVLCSVSVAAFGQFSLPQKSSKAGVSYTLGLTDVNVTYSSPSVNDREVWGSLVPYDKVWRAGANDATTVEFSTDVKVEGEALAAGKYSFFLIPRAEGAWTVIFNKVAEQWGAYDYNEAEDALRLEIEPKMTKGSENRLSYSIVQQKNNKGYIRMGWEKARLYVRFKVDYMDQAISNIEEAIAKNEKPDRLWVVYAQAADFLLGEGKKLDMAQEWADKSTGLFQHGWNHWIKAQIQAANGDTKGALATIEKVKALDTASEEDNFYTDSKAEVDKKVAEWNK